MSPLVSVYIPTKNRFDLLSRAVNSCLAQTYQNLEIIIVDDGSTVAAQNALKEFVEDEPRIVLILSSQSEGACAARNKAIALAKGEFVTGLDDDDEFEPDRIKLFMEYWVQHPDYSFLCSGYQIVTKQSRYSYGTKQKTITADDLLFANYVGNQVFTKTEFFRTVKGFDTAMPSCQDYDAWLRLAIRFGSGMRMSCVTYTVHQEHDLPRISVSNSSSAGYYLFQQKYQHLMSSAQLKSQHFYRVLQTESWSIPQLLVLAGRRTLVVALKNIAIRYIEKLKQYSIGSLSKKSNK